MNIRRHNIAKSCSVESTAHNTVSQAYALGGSNNSFNFLDLEKMTSP